MKDSAFRDMYYNGRGMFDYLVMNAEQKEIAKKLIEYEKEFLKEISKFPSLKERYNQMNMQEQEFNSKCIEEAYKEAFKFGLLLGIEVTK